MRKVTSYSVKQREEILDGQKVSKMSATKYCQKHKIPMSTFYTWKRRGTKTRKILKKGFIRVEDSGVRKRESLRIQTPRGYQLDIPEGVNIGWMHQIVTAVGVK